MPNEKPPSVASTALLGVPIWNPADHGISGVPLMVPAHEFNRVAEAVLDALANLSCGYDIDGNSLNDSDAADSLRNVLPNPAVEGRTAKGQNT